jgi:DNA-directed RNA polymerase beta subunit
MVRIKSKLIRTDACRFATDKPKTASHKSAVRICILLASAVLVFQAGCSTVSPWTKARHRSRQARLSAPYDEIAVKQSIIQNAVPRIQRLNDETKADLTAAETISHSENVVVSMGQSKDGYQSWFNMVTFSENELNVIRKYFFVVDDKTKSIQFEPNQGLRFDCEVELEKEVFADPETSDNARRIEMLRTVLNYFRKDMNELRDDADKPDQGNKRIDIFRMLINQTFDVILRELERSPVLASRLSQAGGVEFDHITFDKGKIQLIVKGDIATVKIRLGAFSHMIEAQQIKPKKERVSKPGSVFRR